jgi:luciferase family oxidoreductase group 1
LGYARFWVAEHHGFGETHAGSNPEVLIARIAALTERIRVGSGTVLLNHYSPFKVAETFRVLHAMSPGRIDLGLGRANGLPVVDYALQRERSKVHHINDYDEQAASA